MKDKNYYNEEKSIAKEEFIKSQNDCYLCGQSLNTYVENLPKSHLIVERAQCQNCMTMVRVKNHTLH